MGLETGTYIDSLVVTNPLLNDPRSEGDDHLRLIKSTLKNTFPNLTGAMTLTQVQLNILLTAGTTGVVAFNVVTQAVGNSTTLAASTAFVQAAAFAAALPAQAGNAGKYVTTDGTTASWGTIYQLTPQAVGFTATAGTTPKTLTVDVDVTASALAQVAASQAEMEAGTETALRTLSPLRVRQAVAALAFDTLSFIESPTQFGGF